MIATTKADPRTLEAIEAGAFTRPADDLLWFPDLGLGYLPPQVEFDYEEEYIEKYFHYEKDGSAQRLSQGRLDFVRRFLSNAEPLVDIGIGAGTFVLTRGHQTSGYDVNQCGKTWLLERGRWHDPFVTPVRNATFWDSLEHAERADAYLETVQKLAFVSMPIFRDLPDLLASKHFKPNEHIYYFTRQGLIDFFEHFGFVCLLTDRFETTSFGREGIESFAFLRKTI